jgi:formylglycine-generating enzyme required for sulfatase activity
MPFIPPLHIGALMIKDRHVAGLPLALASLFLPGFLGAVEPTESRMVPFPSGVWRAEGGTVRYPAFSMAVTELTKGQWDRVRSWSAVKKYDLAPGIGETPTHPVSGLSWYDCIKFCNAASEMYGRNPVYLYRGEAYRSGRVDDLVVDWSANGYRLPSEGEWESACRAGTTTRYFWGDEVFGWESNPYAWSTTHGARGAHVNPQRVAAKKPNPAGLYDMSGNVAEWCWDWYVPVAGTASPRGPQEGFWRILRGGSVALDCPIDSAYRQCVSPAFTMYDVGFRIACSDPMATGIPVEPIVAGASATTESIAATEASDESVTAAAARLFAILNPKQPGLEQAFDHWRAGRAEDALQSYRDYLFAFVRSTPVRNPPRYNGFGGAGKKEELQALMALTDRIPWYRPQRPGGPSYGTNLILGESKKLLKHWETAKDDAMLQQWFHIAGDFALHAKRDFCALDHSERAQPNAYGVPWTWDWGMGFNDYSMWDLRRIIRTLPVDGASRLPALRLAQIATFIATDGVSLVIKDPRLFQPNQALINARFLLAIAHDWPAFRDAPAWAAEGQRRMLLSATKTTFADGGDLEQSFNYSGVAIGEVAEVEAIYGENPPDWVAELKRIMTIRRRCASAMLQPTGGLPSSGTVGGATAPISLLRDPKQLAAYKARQRQGKDPDPVCEAISNRLFGADQSPPPAFTSIALPYSGYYVMRDGWDFNSCYLWFMAARPGMGHAVENINTIEMTAYGRTMLTSGGAGSYGNVKFVNPDQLPIIGQIDAYRDGSASRNTVLVDGQGQRRTASERFAPTSTYKDPIKELWHTSERFDLADGSYRDGYGEKDGPVIHALHRRRVVFVRSAGLWLITDRMQSDAARSYTTVWNFLPRYAMERNLGDSTGFTDAQIHIDEANQTISTRDPGAPNLYIYQASAIPVTYRRFYGALNPARGWYAPWIVGRRYEKTDVWCDWKGAVGTTQLISVVCPSPDDQSPIVASENLSQGTTTGVRLRLRSGASLVWLSSQDNDVLTAGPITAHAESLLLMTEQRGEMHGLVIGCRELTLAGQRQSTSSENVEFTSDGKAMVEQLPIRVPSGFAWVDTAAGAIPDYHPKDTGATPTGAVP